MIYNLAEEFSALIHDLPPIEVDHKFNLELPAGAAAMSCIMDRLRGQELKTAISTATDRLEEFRDAVHALNVFPVTDGDTGTN